MLRNEFFSEKDELRKKLQELVPSAFEDGKLNAEIIENLLGQTNEDANQDTERFGLQWFGKNDAIKIAQKTSEGTLIFREDKSVQHQDSDNLIIEGDNLEVLKILQKSYYSKIKLIYIDPPYNTSNDFIYPDNFNDPIGEYLKKTGQVGEDGEILSSEAETGGRKHTTWLNMMYPRLLLARNLLRDDGVCLVSINDRELPYLLTIMNEIFGEENHEGNFVWKARRKPINVGDSKFKPQKCSEHVIAFSKNKDIKKFLPILSGEDRSYPHTNEEGRAYRLATILKSNRGTNKRSTMTFELNGYTPPEGQRWQGGKASIKELFENGYIEFRSGTPFRRYYQDEEEGEHEPLYTYIDKEKSGSSESGKTDLNELVGNDHGFDTVKPKELIELFIKAICNKDDIILDFFAGTGTTAHAVMAVNNEDEGNRNFILIQFPEEISHPRFNMIPDMTRERIVQAAKELEIEASFKYFSLNSSNFISWEYDVSSPEQMYEQMEAWKTPIKERRSSNDILYEVLLKSGFKLTATIEEHTHGEYRFFLIKQDEQEVMVYVDQEIVTKDVLEEMRKLGPSQIWILDEAFTTDDDKKNIELQWKEEGIAFRTI